MGVATGIDTHDQDAGSGLVIGDAGPRAKRSLVIVARDQPALYEYLTRQFASDPRIVVLMDRRDGARGQASPVTPRPERRQRTGYDHDVRLHWVVVVGERQDPRASDRGASTTLDTGVRNVDAVRTEIHTAEQEITRLHERLVELRRELSALEPAGDASTGVPPERPRESRRERRR